ncbi:hypothetical protein CHISP_0617 [Chitinispirillum alkaliphilum]|nr:hypothetical protein CHISP_0617 [Chitinispirillum alkaliphilum]
MACSAYLNSGKILCYTLLFSRLNICTTGITVTSFIRTTFLPSSLTPVSRVISAT